MGCGKKNESGNGETTGNSGQAVELTGGKSSEALASPHNQLPGYWAHDAEKITQAFKAAMPELTAEELEEYGSVLRKQLSEGYMVLNFSDSGKFLYIYYVAFEGLEIVKCSLLLDDKDATLRIHAESDSFGDIARTGSKALEMVLTEGTLRIDKPAGPKELPMLLSRINSEEAKDLIQKIKEDWADNPRNIRKLRGSQSSDLNRGSE